MVVTELAQLTEDERDLVLRTPALVTILISGADSNFDESEEAKAKKVVRYKSVQGDSLLTDYYSAVDVSFLSSLNHLEQKYDGNADERALKITDMLTQLNSILPKLDKRFATALVADWRNLAKSVAKASGGFLGYASISLAESHFVDLEMISF